MASDKHKGGKPDRGTQKESHKGGVRQDKGDRIQKVTPPKQWPKPPKEEGK